MSEHGHHIDDHGASDAEAYRKIAPPRLEPICGKPLRTCIALRHQGALSGDVHHSASRYIPSRESSERGAPAKVGLLEIQEVILVHATDRLEYRRANQHCRS